MVDESSVVSDVFSELFSILNSNVQTVTLSDNTTSELRKTDSGNHWTGAFPDIEHTSGDAYPIGVVASPTFTEDNTTYTGNTDQVVAEIIVFATRAEAAARFAEKAWDQIRSNQSDLADAGLGQIQTGTSTTDVFVRGDIKVHEYRVPVEMTFEVAV